MALDGATADIVDGWWRAYQRYWAYKSARCQPASMTSVKWYVWPVIKEMVTRGISIQQFRVADFEDRQGARKQAGIRNTTLREEAFFFRALCGIGVRERLIKRNPLAGYPLAPKVAPYTAMPTHSEFRALLRAPRQHYRTANTIAKTKARYLLPRDVAIIVLNARAAMRTCEVFNLLLADYQPAEGRVVVRVAKDNEPRFVPIYADVIRAIDAYLKVRPTCDTDYLFVSDRGEKIKIDWWSKHFKVFSTMAGIPDVTPRAMRHYGLTINAQTNLLAASKAAGHSNLATTKKYLHSDWDHTKAALAAAPHVDLSAAQDGRSSKRVI